MLRKANRFATKTRLENSQNMVLFEFSTRILLINRLECAVPFSDPIRFTDRQSDKQLAAIQVATKLTRTVCVFGMAQEVSSQIGV